MAHDRFYGLAAEEIAQQRVDKDLFARAYAAALGDGEKSKAIYIGIRAERLEQEFIEEEARRSAAVAAETARKISEDEARRKIERDKQRWRFSTEPDTQKSPAQAAAKPKPAPPPEKQYVRPEDIADPKIAESVRVMLEALKAGGGMKR